MKIRSIVYTGCLRLPSVTKSLVKPVDFAYTDARKKSWHRQLEKQEERMICMI